MNSPFTLEQVQWVPQPLDEIFKFFSDAKNLEALTPSWMRFHILTPQPIEIAAGTLIDYRLRWHGIPLRWETEIAVWEPPVCFVDLQLKGPYRFWRHTHRFQAAAGGTHILDSVEYSLPFGLLGRLVHALSVRRNVEEIFEYRRQKICDLFGSAPKTGTRLP